jgi:hypothetical protein
MLAWQNQREGDVVLEDHVLARGETLPVSQGAAATARHLWC